MAECLTMLAGLGAIVFAYLEAHTKHPHANGFGIDIGVTIGVSLFLVGVLFRVQRAIAARLDATRAAITSVQRQFAAQLAEIDAHLAELAQHDRSDAVPSPPTVPQYDPPDPLSILLGEWLARQLQRLKSGLARALRLTSHLMRLTGLRLYLLICNALVTRGFGGALSSRPSRSLPALSQVSC